MQGTPLYDEHRALGARMIPFGGADMPVVYKDIESEHRAVREAAGLFDLGHMGRVRFFGPDRDRLAARCLTFDTKALDLGRTRYALILNEDAGIRDDILVSREAEALLLVINAGNRAVDMERFREQAAGLDVNIVDDTDRQTMVAIQGPRSPAVLVDMGFPSAAKMKYYRFAEVESPFGTAILSRTGYTGEIGFEIFLDSGRVVEFWRAALEIGKAHGLQPCGLGARDTLRLDAGMPLHGHEISADVNPIEAGLEFALRSDEAFVGRDALRRIQESGPRRKLIGLVAEGKRIPRQDCDVLLGDRRVGAVASGTKSITLGTNIATALVDRADAEADEYTISIRGTLAKATRVPMPFYVRKD